MIRRLQEDLTRNFRVKPLPYSTEVTGSLRTTNGGNVEVKLLSSGYWHVRRGSERFAQWSKLDTPRAENFFPQNYWTEQEKLEAVKATQEKEKQT